MVSSIIGNDIVFVIGTIGTYIETNKSIINAFLLFMCVKITIKKKKTLSEHNYITQ